MEPPGTREAGQRLGPYELVAWLGAGASGEVWEAVLHGPGGFRKPVALKLLATGPVDEAARDALVREARLGAGLQHPNVVATLQVGEHDGVWCIALELVRGLSVDRLCRSIGGPLTPSAVLAVGLQAATALQHVHGFTVGGRRAVLVHRDVKPANLLVDRTGLVKLADLGVSLPRGESDGVAGTPSYMAPEQADGQAEPRSDLFSLGAVLYTVATGRRPFGKGAQALSTVRRVEALLDTPGFLSPVDAAVPGLGAVVRWCLRHDPAHRPRSVLELAEALAALPRPPGEGLLDLLARAAPDLAVDTTESPVSDVPTSLHLHGNLRPPRDTFVGRDAEVAALAAEVAAHRWVVLVGPGGAGKTRLALEVARRVRRTMAGGVWAFDLAQARDVEGVCAAVARASDLDLERSDPVGHVGRVLRSRGRALFLLDNLEQCVDALSETVGRWLDLAPDAVFVGTSRILPGLAGERAVPVGELAADDALTLLCARAPRALGPAERPEARALCAMLEGMPLAIELAAARLETVDVATVRTRLSLRLLAGGRADLPERQRSVHASLAWSWELLGPAARTALARLSVFAGSFDAAAAEVVLDLSDLPGAPWALDVLQEVADASLVRVDVATARFRLPVVVREFAAGVATADERAAAEARHGAHYAQLGADAALRQVKGRSGPERLRAFALDLDDLVVACRRAVARGDPDVAAATANAASEVLEVRGPVGTWAALVLDVLALPRLSEVQRDALGIRAGWARHSEGRSEEAAAWFERVTEHAQRRGAPATEATARVGLAVVRGRSARPEEARAHLERAMVLARAAGSGHTEAAALANLGILHAEQGRPEEARAHHERALAIVEEAGDVRRRAGLVANLAGADWEAGRTAEARARFEQVVQLQELAGNRRSAAVALANLASIDADEGRLDDAVARYERALALHREVGDRRFEGITLGGLGGVLARRGRGAGGRRRLEEAAGILREVGDRREEACAVAALARVDGLTVGVAAAREGFDLAERALRELGATVDLAFALVWRAEVHATAGDAGSAGLALDEAAALAPAHVPLGREIARVRATVSSAPTPPSAPASRSRP